MSKSQNPKPPELAEATVLGDGVESAILFTGLHRQRMACGGYAVTGNPIAVKLSPAVEPSSDGARSHSTRISDSHEKAIVLPNRET